MNNVFYYVLDIGANLTGNTFKNLSMFYYNTYKSLASMNEKKKMICCMMNLVSFELIKKKKYIS